MKTTARLYNCARCHCQVVICRHCDRGNIYCNQQCATQARQDALQRASRQYQNTHRGRMANAQRQSRFRESQRKKVTHHGSRLRLSNDVLLRELKRTQHSDKQKSYPNKTTITCHFCQCECSDFLRLDFLDISARGDPEELP